MNEKTFQAIIRYGAIALAIGIIVNIWAVMRNVEIFRDASRSAVQLQQLMLQQQIFQVILQEFAARASSDTEIAAIFKRAQAMGSTTNPASSLPSQPLAPAAPVGETR
jgi:hypothetical protein